MKPTHCRPSGEPCSSGGGVREAGSGRVIKDVPMHVPPGTKCLRMFGNEQTLPVTTYKMQGLMRSAQKPAPDGSTGGRDCGRAARHGPRPDPRGELWWQTSLWRGSCRLPQSRRDLEPRKVGQRRADTTQPLQESQSGGQNAPLPWLLRMHRN